MTGEERRRRGHPLFAAVYEWRSPSLEAGPIGRTRRDLLRHAEGVVVDLGAGIGLNLPHLDTKVTRIHLVEPDPSMTRRLEAARPEHARIHQSGAEALPLADASADTVLATLTLCTVDDLAAAVAEMRRVLRPGGQVLLLEHVRSPDRRLAMLQDVVQWPWYYLSAGCRPNRDTVAALSSAGFDVGSLSRFRVPTMGPAMEWVTGRITLV